VPPPRYCPPLVRATGASSCRGRKHSVSMAVIPAAAVSCCGGPGCPGRTGSGCCTGRRGTGRVLYSRVPVLAGWADLDQREADAGITARHPILIDPQFRIDPVRTPRTTGCSSPSYGSAGSTGTRRIPMTCWTGSPGAAAASRGSGSAAASGSGSWRFAGPARCRRGDEAVLRRGAGWRRDLPAAAGPVAARVAQVAWVTPFPAPTGPIPVATILTGRSHAHDG
jgi:hypothetical protein